MKPIVFMFSGQGSHYYHMGRELFDQHPIFKYWMLRMDDMARDILNISILDTLYDDAKNKTDLFDQTTITSLAIIMVEYALAKVVIEKGIKPDYILGSSLGEVTASIVSNADDLDQALISVFRRVQLYESHCPKGGMIGVLDNVEIYDSSSDLFQQSELAAINFDSHFVVSCQLDKMENIKNYLAKSNVAYQTLNVSRGFHSSMLDSVEPLVKKIVKDKIFKKPEIPIISCMLAGRVLDMDGGYFWNVFRKPILFQKTIEELESQDSFVYLDLGPSGTLAGFVKYNLTTDSESEYFPIMTPYGGELNRLSKAQQLFSN